MASATGSPEGASEAGPSAPEAVIQAQTEAQQKRDDYEELMSVWATEGAKRICALAEWKPGAGNNEQQYGAAVLGGGDNAAQAAGRLEAEIRAAVEMGPPPGMSKRQWERVQIAARKQLAALDDHPDVFKVRF